MPLFNKNKHKKSSRFVPSKAILLDFKYPIGHATGLNADEWQKFADEYIPFSERS